MSSLVVITFDNQEEAGKVREAVKGLQKKGLISLDDSAVIEKDQEGKIHVKNELDRGVKSGVAGGSLVGLCIGFILGGPIGAMAVGAVGGGLVGATVDLGLQKSFVKEVSEKIQPGTSALFIAVHHANPAAAVAALKPFKGELYHTSLSPEDEETLRRALSKRE
jgi:uncharacterized membrane protein